MDGAVAFLMPREEDGAMLAAVNGHLAKAGVSITREDALALGELRNESLADLERVEFGKPAVVDIAEAIADSPCLTQRNAAKALAQLQGTFYRLRDELPVDVPDAEIVEALSACLNELGDAADVAEMPLDELMAFSKDYAQALDAQDVDTYRIVDDEERAYAFDLGEWECDERANSWGGERAGEWEYDERADGWDGEGWADDWDD